MKTKTYKSTILFIPKLSKKEHQGFIDMLADFAKFQQSRNRKIYGKYRRKNKKLPK